MGWMITLCPAPSQTRVRNVVVTSKLWLIFVEELPANSRQWRSGARPALFLALNDSQDDSCSQDDYAIRLPFVAIAGLNRVSISQESLDVFGREARSR